MIARSLAARLRLGLSSDTTLGTVLERLAAVHSGRRLVEEAGGRSLTYHEAAAKVDGWAGGIATAIRPSDRVVVATPNTYDQFLLSLAACRAGGIAAPVNDHMRAEEIDHVIADAGAALVLRDASDVPAAPPLRHAVPAAPGDVAALFYTSGTTGKPKGVELTHRGLLSGVQVGALLPVMQLRRDEAVISLPIAHIMGFAILAGLAGAGIPTCFLPHFRPGDVLDALESRRATMFVGVPAMYRMLLDAGAEQRDLSSVRVWGSGADVMPTELADRFRKMGATARLPLVGSVGDALFFEGYGLAESAGAVATKVHLPIIDRLLPGDSVGTPLPGYRLKVVDEDGRPTRPGQVGELLVKGPGITPGYWGDGDATSALLTSDGWLRTGDLASPGPFGSVRFAGRSKHVVKRGGYSVYAVEVEAALERHPQVSEAAVVGIPDERLGEVPAAAVLLGPGATVTPDELVEFAAEHLADYKVPVQVVIVDELPRTGTRKVQRDRLRELFTPR